MLLPAKTLQSVMLSDLALKVEEAFQVYRRLDRLLTTLMVLEVSITIIWLVILLSVNGKGQSHPEKIVFTRRTRRALTARESRKNTRNSRA